MSDMVRVWLDALEDFNRGITNAFVRAGLKLPPHENDRRMDYTILLPENRR